MKTHSSYIRRKFHSSLLVVADLRGDSQGADADRKVSLRSVSSPLLLRI